MNLDIVGEPENLFIKLSDDILPDPGAVLLTGITPQMTITDGLTEAEFLKYFYKNIATEGTIFVGYNNIRFDDEFIRFINYRNFYDAYEWHWSQQRSRWDMLDVVRMTRALRPEGIEWSFAPDNTPSNRLEHLATVNKLVHDKAHDALSDVRATIALAQLLRTKQPKLFAYLLKYRDKKILSEFVNSNKPFAYTSGKYPSKYLHTTVAINLGAHPKNQGVIVYDLRHDPQQTIDLSEAEMLERWRHKCFERPCPHPRLPVKTMQFNRCPAVAPFSVIDGTSAQRIQLDLKLVNNNYKKFQLLKNELYPKILKVIEQLDQKQAEIFSNEQLAETALYDGFIPETDKKLSQILVNAAPNQLPSYIGKFEDKRLQSLLPLYISKNYPKLQTDEIRAHWEKFKTHKLLDGGDNSRGAAYFKQIADKMNSTDITGQQKYLLEELKLWGQSILPEV